MKKQQDDFETFLMVDPSGISEQIKKMYNLLNSVESDDLITIEDHKKYLELLRKFRQVNLETMRFMGKRFVETLESLLSVGEDGVYSNNYRFIYELIQNVDDCDYKDVKDCHLDMQFQYQNNPGRIVLTYNELGFTPQNVFAITGIAEASKNINAEKVEIGEKGIGFKSVFGIADKVYIESGMFSFSLSKENFTVPEPHYENFVPVKGTRMTLEMPADKCKEVYRALVNQYMKKDAVLNKNPVLFLNKLTHLKLYFDGFRYLEFNVERKEPVCRNGLRIEEEVALSVNMEDYINGISQKHKSEILCYRYTTPLVYGEIACKSRYGIDTAFSERKHNLVAVFPVLTEELKDYKGVMYSFLPTQIKLNAPIILHVPYKLDGSREFVDPQSNNEWFKYTTNNLISFVKKVYSDFAHILHEDVVPYIPSVNKNLFRNDNEKVDCLCNASLSGHALCNENLFFSTDRTYESSNNIVSFSVNDTITEPEKVYQLLGIQGRKLFIPPREIDMKRYGVSIINDVPSILFKRAMESDDIFDDVVIWLQNHKKDLRYEELISQCGSISLTQNHLVCISKNRQVMRGFLRAFNRSIKNGATYSVRVVDKSLYYNIKLQKIIQLLIKEADLDKSFKDYLKNIDYKICFLKDCKTDFYIATKNAMVLSESTPLSSISRIVEEYDPRGTFSATLKLKQASAKLDRADDSLSNEDYLKLLRSIRRSLVDVFGEKTYKNYVGLINKAGSDSNRFLNELLQNADDCSYSSEVIPTFSLHAERGALIVSYNEDGFTKENVRSITAIGESTKRNLITGKPTIGEKGIGFKTVFGVAKSVEIHSNGFHFSLKDQTPTIPDSCEEIAVESGTTMRFELKKLINNLLTKEHILKLCICLRNLKSLEIQDYQISIEDRENQREIRIGNERYVFEKVEYSFTVDDSDATFERTTYRGPISNKQRIVLYIPKTPGKFKEFNVYTGLPLDIRSNVPLIIDAPFDLNTSREGILENKWNEIIREKVYKAILFLMTLHAEDGLDIFRYVGFRSSKNNKTWENFDNKFLNNYIFKKLIKNSSIIKVIGVEKPVRPGNQCKMIPEFAINKIKADGIGKSNFKGLIVDTQGKSQFGPLLEDLECQKATRFEIRDYLKSVVKDSIDNKTFREQLYAYLSGNQGNFAFQDIGESVMQIPIIPVKTITGTRYISYNKEIYTHKNQVSQEGYFILDEKIMSYDMFINIFKSWGKISELNDETLLLRYQNKLKELIDGPRTIRDKAILLLSEFNNNHDMFNKCIITLKGMLSKIPMEMEDGSIKVGNKFINEDNLYFAGSLLKSLIVNSKYRKLAEALECRSIRSLHFDDIDIEIEDIIDDDIEDLQTEQIDNCFRNYSEIITNLVNEGLISDEQIIKYELGFADVGYKSTTNYEEFPELYVKNISKLKEHISHQWVNSPNPYIEKKITKWEPKYNIYKKEYTADMYKSTMNEGMCFCQMCKRIVPERYIERNSLEKTPKFAWGQMHLSLCLNCSKDYIIIRNNGTVWKNFISDIMSVDPMSCGLYQIPLGNKEVYFTATHIAEVQEIIRVEGLEYSNRSNKKDNSEFEVKKAEPKKDRRGYESSIGKKDLYI